MKTIEELNALKEELEALNKKLAELSEDEMEQVTGGNANGRIYWKGNRAPKNSESSDNAE